jgi:hypothetical protein
MNASGYRRFLLLVFVILLNLALITPAAASKPDMFTAIVDDTFEAADCGGFTLIESVQGRVKFSGHFDRDGNFVMEIARFSLKHTFTNSVTGASLFSPDVGIDKTVVNPDGSGTVAVVGVVSRIVVPGEGVVFRHLGRLVFDLETDEVVFEAGQHDDFAELVPLLCSALS